MRSDTLVDAALTCAQRGWHVFPLFGIVNSRCTCGKACGRDAGKHPATRRGFKDATDEPSTIITWWTAQPHANIGLATGTCSGVDVFDIDRKGEAYRVWQRLLERHGPLDTTPHARTGGDGDHFFFKHVPGLKRRIGLWVDGRRVRGLDALGDGGYAVLAPSRHKSGREYTWVIPPTDAELAPWPTWLLALALAEAPRVQRVVRAVVRADAVPGDRPPPRWLQKLCQNGAPQGRRHTEAFKVACAIVREVGYTSEGESLLQAFALNCDPPMAQREIDRIWSDVPNYETYGPRASRDAASMEGGLYPRDLGGRRYSKDLSHG
jgi:hypothetical protein